MKTSSVLVLGAGKMTEAILIGLKETTDLSQWFIYSPSGTSAEALAQKVGAKAVRSFESLSPDWILVGCKPQQLPDLKTLIGESFNSVPFVSMLAALSEEQQRDALKASQLVRVMPNLPVRYNKGVTLVASHSAPDFGKKIQQLFAHLGVALIVEETELEELTLLTGSGPAFFYEFALSLSQSFSSLTPERREFLARAVLQGAALSSVHSEAPLEKMINDVTSKGGVTIAVLEHWRKLSFADFIKKGIEAGKQRSAELVKLIQRS